MKKPESEPWVTINLRVYGNSLVPNEVVDEYGIEASEKIISYALGKKVRIEERHPMMEIGLQDNRTYELRKKPIYIAEVVNE